jgi:tetrathionate reductase subunit B
VSYTERGEYPQVQRNFLPLLCNQCDNPPCVDVCPSGATYRREDGIVMQVDEKCIGCKACIQGCPYRVKFVNPETKTAQKCDFCVHRVDQGIVPSCVNTCNARARIFGDLNNPDSEISKVIQENKVQSLRTELGTEPRVFYIGLDQFSYDPVKSKAPGISHEHGDLK